MLQIDCSGTPAQIGHQHGTAAAAHITRSIAFYTGYFKLKAGLNWAAATAAAERFLPNLARRCPHLVEEMRGVALGAGVQLSDVLALNVRSEIAMGMGLPSDGCTAVFGKPTNGEGGVLAQNWDWERAQAENLVVLNIAARDGGLPAISMITEAGIIGKIGLNAAGVGVCLNAVRAKGVDYDRLPVHVALRLALERETRDGAVEYLTKAGVAAACHILVADEYDGSGVEFSHADAIALPTFHGVLTHTNHWLVPHDGPDGTLTMESFLADSEPRLKRIDRLFLDGPGYSTAANIGKIEHALQDETNFPESINRAPSKTSDTATLFSIIMDLGERTATVKVGRPTEPSEIFQISAE